MAELYFANYSYEKMVELVFSNSNFLCLHNLTIFILEIDFVMII